MSGLYIIDLYQLQKTAFIIGYSSTYVRPWSRDRFRLWEVSDNISEMVDTRNLR